jgi:hypothetical protein
MLFTLKYGSESGQLQMVPGHPVSKKANGTKRTLSLRIGVFFEEIPGYPGALHEE